MKHVVLLAGTVLATAGIAPAAAATASAPFGCDARAPSVCFFRVYMGARMTRDLRLPAGTKEKIPDVEVGKDRYCMALNKPPAYKCTRKTIDATYNN